MYLSVFRHQYKMYLFNSFNYYTVQSVLRLFYSFEYCSLLCINCQSYKLFVILIYYLSRIIIYCDNYFSHSWCCICLWSISRTGDICISLYYAFIVYFYSKLEIFYIQLFTYIFLYSLHFKWSEEYIDFTTMSIYSYILSENSFLDRSRRRN